MSHAERTRADILGVAAQLAAQEGLEGLSLGGLAATVGMSKGGVFAHFGSKEALQLATVEAALVELTQEVFTPAASAPPGLPRLRMMIDLYFGYVSRRGPSGGCFFTAASVEFDDRPGAVRDRIVQVTEQRSMLIEGAIREALPGLAPADVAQLAFETVALSTGAVIQFQLTKDSAVLDRARRALEARLESAKRRGSRPAEPPRSRR